MTAIRDFAKRVGSVFIPVADTVPITDDPANSPAKPSPVPFPPVLRCLVKLREGCYSVTFLPKTRILFGPRFLGTLRVENIDAANIRFSGDLYSIPQRPVLTPVSPVHLSRVDRLRLAQHDRVHDAPTEDAPGVIPIFPRRKYTSYLKGTSAVLSGARTVVLGPCPFSLNFDEFTYAQPATGFNGTFPSTPSRSIRYALETTATPDTYTGKVFQGTTELGSVSIQWVSPSFRRASLVIFQLQGAEDPPTSVPKSGGGTEDFHSVFATAGWDLSVNFVANAIPLPGSLVGVQDPNQCWSQANCAALMSSAPGYNPADLDTVWRATLLAIPAKIGCSRGQMFDTGSGNPNNIAREGAVTHSRDGYPVSDSAHFDAAAGGMQKDFPRAFLRSASHEVGHTFNQIHQEFEGGSDNSIMTTTPSVADVLFSEGKTFPNDINLGFNATVRRHLVHLPDPCVRPGAMDFFGAAVNAPQADQILWPEELKVQVHIQDPQISLGEALPVEWTLTNEGMVSALVPEHLDIESLTSRVSVTDPDGKTTFLRPAEQNACYQNPLKELQPQEIRKGSTQVFWGRDGFAFERPGRHTVEVIVMWQVAQVWVATNAEADVWVSFPVSDQDNQVAALMLHHEVGMAVAAPSSHPTETALHRLSEAVKVNTNHRAITRLRTLKMHERLKL
jgi:hypothetical protein